MQMSEAPKPDLNYPCMNRWFWEFMESDKSLAYVICPEGKHTKFVEHYEERYQSLVTYRKGSILRLGDKRLIFTCLRQEKKYVVKDFRLGYAA